MERSTQDSCTLYEVYDKRTGRAITRKHDGVPVQARTITLASLIVKSIVYEHDPNHAAAVRNFDIPKQHNIGVRRVTGVRP